LDVDGFGYWIYTATLVVVVVIVVVVVVLVVVVVVVLLKIFRNLNFHSEEEILGEVFSERGANNTV
jgi:hypothetical protein